MESLSNYPDSHSHLPQKKFSVSQDGKNLVDQNGVEYYVRYYPKGLLGVYAEHSSHQLVVSLFAEKLNKLNQTKDSISLQDLFITESGLCNAESLSKSPEFKECLHEFTEEIVNILNPNKELRSQGTDAQMFMMYPKTVDRSLLLLRLDKLKMLGIHEKGEFNKNIFNDQNKLNSFSQLADASENLLKKNQNALVPDKQAKDDFDVIFQKVEDENPTMISWLGQLKEKIAIPYIIQDRIEYLHKVYPPIKMTPALVAEFKQKIKSLDQSWLLDQFLVACENVRKKILDSKETDFSAHSLNEELNIKLKELVKNFQLKTDGGFYKLLKNVAHFAVLDALAIKTNSATLSKHIPENSLDEEEIKKLLIEHSFSTKDAISLKKMLSSILNLKEFQEFSSMLTDKNSNPLYLARSYKILISLIKTRHFKDPKGIMAEILFKSLPKESQQEIEKGMQADSQAGILHSMKSSFKRMWMKRGVLQHLEKIQPLKQAEKDHLKKYLDDPLILANFQNFIKIYQKINHAHTHFNSLPDHELKKEFDKLYQQINNKVLQEWLKPIKEKTELPTLIHEEIRYLRQLFPQKFDPSMELILNKKMKAQQNVQEFHDFLTACHEAREHNLASKEMDFAHQGNMELHVKIEGFINRLNLDTKDPFLQMLRIFSQFAILDVAEIKKITMLISRLLPPDWIDPKKIESLFIERNFSQKDINSMRILLDALEELNEFHVFKNNVNDPIQHKILLLAIQKNHLVDPQGTLAEILLQCMSSDSHLIIKENLLEETKKLSYGTADEKVLKKLQEFLEQDSLQALGLYQYFVQACLSEKSLFSQLSPKTFHEPLDRYLAEIQKLNHDPSLTGLLQTMRNGVVGPDLSILQQTLSLSVLSESHADPNYEVYLQKKKQTFEKWDSLTSQERFLYQKGYVEEGNSPGLWQKVEWKMKSGETLSTGDRLWKQGELVIKFALPAQGWEYETQIPLDFSKLNLVKTEKYSVHEQNRLLIKFIQEYSRMANILKPDEIDKRISRENTLALGQKSFSHRKDYFFLVDEEYRELGKISRTFYERAQSQLLDAKRMALGLLEGSSEVKTNPLLSSSQDVLHLVTKYQKFLGRAFSTEERKSFEMLILEPENWEKFSTFIDFFEKKYESNLAKLKSSDPVEKLTVYHREIPRDVLVLSRDLFNEVGKRVLYLEEIYRAIRLVRSHPGPIPSQIDINKLISFLDNHPQRVLMFRQFVENAQSLPKIEIQNFYDSLEVSARKNLDQNVLWQNLNPKQVENLAKKLSFPANNYHFSSDEKKLLDNCEKLELPCRELISLMKKSNSTKDYPYQELENIVRIVELNDINDRLKLFKRNTLLEKDLDSLSHFAEKNKKFAEGLNSDMKEQITACKKLVDSEDFQMITKAEYGSLLDEELTKKVLQIINIANSFSLHKTRSNYSLIYRKKALQLHAKFQKKFGKEKDSKIQQENALQMIKKEFPFLMSTLNSQEEKESLEALIKLIIFGKEKQTLSSGAKGHVLS